MKTPTFTLEDDLWWTAEVTLESWAGFQVRGGAYGAMSSDDASDGTVQLLFAPEGRETEPLNADELALINWFVAHEPAVSAAVQEAIVQAYPQIQEQFGSQTYAGVPLPDVTSVGDLKDMVGLYSVNIHQVSRDGVPYIGYELGCNWDDEHGVGVLMHGTRVVEVGGADTAILLWIAEQDAEEDQ